MVSTASPCMTSQAGLSPHPRLPLLQRAGPQRPHIRAQLVPCDGGARLVPYYAGAQLVPYYAGARLMPYYGGAPGEAM